MASPVASQSLSENVDKSPHMDSAESPRSPPPLTRMPHETDSGICLTPQSQGGLDSPQQRHGIESARLNEDDKKSLEIDENSVKFPQLDVDSNESSELHADCTETANSQNVNSALSTKAKLGNSKTAKLNRDKTESKPYFELDRSESAKLNLGSRESSHRRQGSHGGLDFFHQSQSSFDSPRQSHSGPEPSQYSQKRKTNSPQSNRFGTSHRPTGAATALKLGESIAGSDSRGSTPDHSRSPRSSSRLGLSQSQTSQSSDSFAYQTRYLVLQFLQQSTREQNLLYLSHNSLSTTSESEPRLRSHAQLMREQWQSRRAHSQCSPSQQGSKSRLLAKTKGSRSSPNLKDAKFFEDLPAPRTIQRRPQSSRSKASRSSSRRSPKLPRRSPVQAVSKADFVRSVSETTDASETGTYWSDADDELDTSFDSSQQGSVTSAHLRQRLAAFHKQVHAHRLPTVHSETESIADVSTTVPESPNDPSDDASPVLSVDMIQMEESEMLSPASQSARVNEYLLQMSQASAGGLDAPDDFSLEDATAFQNDPIGGAVQWGGGVIDGPSGNMAVGSESNTNTVHNVDVTVQNEALDEVDSPPFHQRSFSDLLNHDSDFLQSGHPHDETGAVSGGFEPQMSHDDQLDGAWGGQEDGVIVAPPTQGADRSHLRLDLSETQDAGLLDAMQHLQQEIDEEMSSLETEFEEVLHGLHSDHSWHSHTLNHSRSFSPETAEAARLLAKIGDEVQRRHFDNMEAAVGRLLVAQCAGLFTYQHFREAALTAIDRDLVGWDRVSVFF